MNEEDFKKFNDLILQLASQFFVWEYLYIENQKNISAYNLRSHFWTPVLRALFDDFLLLLANIFDNKDDRILSVYKLLESTQDKNKKDSLLSEIRKHDVIIKQIITWRCNILAHKNASFVQNPDQLAKKFPIYHNDAKDLLNLLVRVIQEIAPNDGEYYKFYEEVKNHCIKDTQFILDNGLRINEQKID